MRGLFELIYGLFILHTKFSLLLNNVTNVCVHGQWLKKIDNSI